MSHETPANDRKCSHSKGPLHQMRRRPEMYPFRTRPAIFAVASAGEIPAKRGKPTRGLEPRTPSLRVKCSVSELRTPAAADWRTNWRTSLAIPANRHLVTDSKPLPKIGGAARRSPAGSARLYASPPTLGRAAFQQPAQARSAGKGSSAPLSPPLIAWHSPLPLQSGRPMRRRLGLSWLLQFCISRRRVDIAASGERSGQSGFLSVDYSRPTRVRLPVRLRRHLNHSLPRHHRGLTRVRFGTLLRV